MRYTYVLRTACGTQPVALAQLIKHQVIGPQSLHPSAFAGSNPAKPKPLYLFNQMNLDLTSRFILLIFLLMQYAGLFATVQTMARVPAQYLWPIMVVPVVSAVAAFMLRRFTFSQDSFET